MISFCFISRRSNKIIGLKKISGSYRERLWVVLVHDVYADGRLHNEAAREVSQAPPFPDIRTALIF
jgi:hypothetical protein